MKQNRMFCQFSCQSSELDFFRAVFPAIEVLLGPGILKQLNLPSKTQMTKKIIFLGSCGPISLTCVYAQSLQSCPTLCDPMDCSPLGSSVHGILQTRVLKWVAMPSSRGSSQPRDWTCSFHVSCIGRWVLYHKHHLGSLSYTPHVFLGTSLALVNGRTRTDSWCTELGAVNRLAKWNQVNSPKSSFSCSTSACRPLSPQHLMLRSALSSTHQFQ